MIPNVYYRFARTLWSFFRSIRIIINRKRIKKSISRTIVCNNCLGGIISNDLGMKFCSPFVNLWIPGEHYIEILKDIMHLSKYSIEEVSHNSSRYPIGVLNKKWELHFMHYKSFDEAVHKWRERVERMDIKNMYVILVETSSVKYDDMVEFDKLPFKNKILITHKYYPEIKCAVAIEKYDEININGELFSPYNIWGMKKYDQINWIDFLNLR